MNGSVMSTHDKNGTYDFGAIVQYTCDVGFTLTGSPSIECVVGNSSEEFVWTDPAPSCQQCQGRVYFFLSNLKVYESRFTHIALHPICYLVVLHCLMLNYQVEDYHRLVFQILQ